MDILKEDLPATLQAFELQGDKEIFLAEQVVNNQSEIAIFTARYAGKLIKAKAQTPPNTYNTNYRATTIQKRGNSSVSIVVLVIVAILIALAVYGYSTGWLQQQLHLNQ